MNKKYLTFPHKQIRAEAIKKYIKGLNKKVICFSCGNAAEALENEGLDVLHIGEHGVLDANVWFSQQSIGYLFPDYFDATSGHLNMELMLIIAMRYKEYLGELSSPVYLPTGSGETLVCLKLVYPEVDFVAVYNLGPETEYSEYAPLNPLVRALASEVIF